MKQLEDQVVLRILGRLSPAALLELSTTCKAFYCFANHEELWRAIVLGVTSPHKLRLHHHLPARIIHFDLGTGLNLLHTSQ